MTWSRSFGICLARRNSSNLLLRKEKPPVIGRLIFCLIELFLSRNVFNFAFI